MSRQIRIALFVLFTFTITVFAEEPVDLDVVSKIKAEGFENSRVMDLLFYLTDVHGPRLTNSPNYRAASQWCVDKFNEWGLENAALESWGTFGRGWATDNFSIAMIEPQYLNIIAYPKAWTPGTDGVISGEPILMEVESEKDLNDYRGQLLGAIVMTGEPRDLEPHFEALAKRHDEQSLAELMQAPEPGAKPSWWERRAEFRRRRALRRKTIQFLKDEGAAVILEPSQRDYGTLRVHRGGSHEMDAEPALPALAIAAEHYGRIARLLKNGIAVNLKINVQNRFFADDTLGYNVVAELPGSHKKLQHELVMLGGHLDSWHAGTGATDNAAGCVVAMEAIRILKTLGDKYGIKPNRTIRIALWGGEEQGLRGSRGYAKKHFGDRRTMTLKNEHDTFSAYYNLDNGSGKIRGIYLQQNDAVRPIFEAYLEPFHDLGASTVTIRNTGGTDHLAFDALGLPGFQFIQDPLEYQTRTHHSSMDVYDHVVKSDLIQASVIMASFVYHTAMRPEKLPRKPLPEPEERSQAANGR
ncbi:M20/M25/M40 family metallo-hydrolase [candidate division KSB1 bacterium]|nr:M20/M25/M40 family metallo-hydrolase [candidate division KSB1 bacterium]NIR68983.1 M20/M25/M40 family metallo-hydrolase [candidate division KSB1 bacterium]NIS22605.1 M20/M25/M40 family metallo-hydrolase [candidate division KSB1 bacterium]NIT69465.1 M20/M25/M40 family metallo-hydrolase [candidate division KSB1 bacterium]NIU23120.1 M20/M25/M40 family metallo-hydrolase [candidate division KSB1 bacterium]